MTEVKIISDVHLEHYYATQYFPHIGRGDILVLAGDILCAKHLKTDGYLKNVYKTFLEECSKNYTHVLYIMGNHEFWGYNYESVPKLIREHLPDNVHLLDNETFTYKDWNFICATLWTNFRNANPIEMLDAEMHMNDYKSIRIGSNYRKLRAQDTLNFHVQSRDYILQQLEILKENVFIITHHAPSYRSIAEKHKNSACNSAYCSNLDDLIISHPQIKYWCHGHVHTRFDYMIGESCRVICNPVGHPHDDTGYDPHLTITL